MTFEELDKLFNNPTMKAIDRIYNNPTMRAIQSIECALPKAFTEHLNDPAYRAMQRAGLHSKFLQSLEHNPIFRSNFAFLEQNQVLLNALNIANKYSIIKDFAYTSSEDLTGDVTDLELDSAIELSAERLGELPQKRLSLEFYLSNLIALAFLVYSFYSASESEVELYSRLNTIESLITTVVNEIESAPTEQHFIVKTALNLRAKPSETSHVIEVLPSKLKVSGVTTSGEWLKIEYYDYLSDQMVSGWVDSSFLLPLIAEE